MTLIPSPRRPPRRTLRPRLESLEARALLASSSLGQLTEWTIPGKSGNSRPWDIAAGPDGNLWFTQLDPTNGNAIGSLSPSGSFHEYSAGLSAAAQPAGITSVPGDTRVFFAEYATGNLGWINTSTNSAHEIHELPLTPAFSNPILPAYFPQQDYLIVTQQGSDSLVEVSILGNPTVLPCTETSPCPQPTGAPYAVVADGQGFLYFTENAPGKIGVFGFDTTTQQAKTWEYPTPSNTRGVASSPLEIVLGPDGNFWYTDHAADVIGTFAPFDPSTEAPTIKEYSLGGKLPGKVGPWGIVSDDARDLLYFTAQAGDAVGSIDLNGNVVFTAVQAGGAPQGITFGPDGDLYFTETGANAVGKIDLGIFVYTTGGAAAFGPLSNYHVSPSIVVGPDGNLWMTPDPVRADAFRYGKLTTDGQFTGFGAPDPYSAWMTGLAAGPDGNLWISGVRGYLYKVNTAGQVLSATAIFVGDLSFWDAAVIAGPDGNIWTIGTGGEGNTSNVVDPQTGRLIHTYRFPGLDPGLFSIAVGPDGHFWFTLVNFSDNTSTVYRMATDGTATSFAVPTVNAYASSIVAGPDGNMWFTERGSNEQGTTEARGAIGRISTAATTLSSPITLPANATLTLPDGTSFGPNSTLPAGTLLPVGTITEFATPNPNAQPYSIVAGPDGNLWFTGYADNTLNRITPAGVVTPYPIPAGLNGPLDLVAGPDGLLWFTVTGNQIVAAVTPPSGGSGGPEDPNSSFLGRAYEALLNQPISGERLAGLLPLVGPRGLTPATTRQVARALAVTPEFRARQVIHAYQAILLRNPGAAELAAGLQDLDPNGGTIRLQRRLAASDAFFAERGGSTPAGFVQALAESLWGRSLGPARARRLAGQLSRAALVRAFLASGRSLSRDAANWYNRLLGRDPSPGESRNAVRLLRARGPAALPIHLLHAEQPPPFAARRDASRPRPR